MVRLGVLSTSGYNEIVKMRLCEQCLTLVEKVIGREANNLGYRLGVDVGGTFTDFVLFDEDTKRLVITKVPSTPRDQSEGVIDGIKKITKEAGIHYQDIFSFTVQL